MKIIGKVTFSDYGMDFGPLDKPIKEAFAEAVNESFGDWPCAVGLSGTDVVVGIPTLSEDFSLSFRLTELIECVDWEAEDPDSLSSLQDFRADAAALLSAIDAAIDRVSAS